MKSQSEDEDFDTNACSDNESIIGRMLNDKKDTRVRIKTMKVIENLLLIIADIPKCLYSQKTGFSFTMRFISPSFI